MTTIDSPPQSAAGPAASPAAVTVLGLGLMGQALAAAFLRAGHPTTVWNRTPAKGDALVAQGAARADTARAAVAASPLVVVCLTDYDAVGELLDPLGEELAGKVVANLTSGTSQQARLRAEWAHQRECAYLDGAIMASPPGIGTPEAVIFYSGPTSAYGRYESALQALTPASVHLGEDHGLSSLYDVAVLSLMWNILNGFLHGAALVGTAGVDATTFAPVARQGIETVAGWLAGYAQQVDDGDYPAVDATIDTHQAAMDHLIHECEALGVSDELPRLIKATAERAVAAGQGGASYAAMIGQFRAPARDRK